MFHDAAVVGAKPHNAGNDVLREPRFLLVYPALQFAPEEQAKPDGSLGVAYLAASLRRSGYPVRILDVAVGNENDALDDGFRRTTPLSTGLVRVGISPERIAQELEDADVVGVTSIFTPQTKMVFELFALVKRVAPEKLVITGGVNARSMRKRFFDAGADFIFLSEAEQTILEFAEYLRGKRALADVSGIAYRDETGREHVQPATNVVAKLDDLPMPAWDMLPLEKYWTIARPHGGQFQSDERIAYAAMQTSRGCPFSCRYCHISKETEGSAFGHAAKWRAHSIERVIEELHVVKGLGAEHVFFEDDSLFANKRRALQLFREASALGLRLADVNGINIVHLLKRRAGRLCPDQGFLELLALAGFTWLTLPFESATPRLVAKYASAKWDPAKTDTAALVRACTNAGIKTVGNYMLGYPDETILEIHATVRMAKSHIDEGMNHALFFSVVPFPGTVLFDEVIANGQLDPSFDPDDMKWTKSILRESEVSVEALEGMRQLAWLTVNRSDYVDYKLGQRVTKLRG